MTAAMNAIQSDVSRLRQLTRELNLHVPPSYFASSESSMLYEDALVSVARASRGPCHVYIGVPLCEEHCRFCMYFYGLADDHGRRAEACVGGLVELLDAVGMNDPVSAAGMYIGGGTPTILDNQQIDRLLAAVNEAIVFEPTSQRTFEMSPRSCTRAKVRAMVRGGINRLSFGVQSFDRRPVERAGRGYVEPARIAQIITMCREEGIHEINADLMVGLDGESDDSLASSVETLLDLDCPTVSIYRYRPARKAELMAVGGMDAYVRICAARMQRAADVATRYDREISGRIDGEHVRLIAPGPCPWPERNLYETRYRPDLRNSLVGFGSGARSFSRDERLLHCEHRAVDGFRLVGRAVEVEDCDPPSRLAAALVNGFFRDFEVDLDCLPGKHHVDTWADVNDPLDGLIANGVLVADGSRLKVTADHQGDWVYWDKVLYPREWLRRRALSERLRVR